ncbi:MAG: hypothetical protein ABIO72_03040 [Patescibacteria group bacterium]
MDGGWPLEINPPPLGQSSIVNTAEAAMVLSVTGRPLASDDPAVGFLRKAVIDHRKQRGDVTRFLSFAILGLRACGLGASDPSVVSIATELRNRYDVAQRGWGERQGAAVSLFSTYYALEALRRSELDAAEAIHGSVDAARTMLQDSNYRAPLNSLVGGSLVGTAYAALILSFGSPSGTESLRLQESLRELLAECCRTGAYIFLEPQPNATWHHYALALGLRALARVSKTGHSSPLTLKYLGMALAAVLDTRGPVDGVFREHHPNLRMVVINVRSIYNYTTAIGELDDALRAASLLSAPAIRALEVPCPDQGNGMPVPQLVPHVPASAPGIDEHERSRLYGRALALHLGVILETSPNPVRVRIVRNLEPKRSCRCSW